MATWSPSLAALRKGAATAVIRGRDTPATVQWQFTELRRRLPLGATVACKMTVDGEAVAGYGDRLLRHGACVVAFAEAWERFHLDHVTAEVLQDAPPPSSSNGVAAGPTDAAALEWARRELVDRTLFLSAWQTMTGLNPIERTGFAASALAAMISSQGWTPRLYAVSSPDVPETCIAAFAFHPTFGLAFDSLATGPWEHPATATRRAMALLLRVVDYRTRIHAPGFELPIDGGPEDHARFYTDPGRAAEVRDLLGAFRPGQVRLATPGATRSVLLWSAGEFPAVAYAYNKSWPRLLWGRRSIEGTNPWPHPLA